MSLTAVILILISAVSHAGWNLLGKRDNPSISFFLLTNIFGVLTFSPVLLFYFDQINQLPVQIWYYLATSGFCLAIYFTGLAGAYRSGDMTVAYPLARSLPVIVVTFVALLLGRGGQLSQQSVLGIMLVVGGCFMVPLHRFKDFSLSNYLNATCLLALLAAFGTAGYSMVDDEALRLFRGLSELKIPVHTRSLVYGCLQGGFTICWLTLFTLLSPKERIQMRCVVGYSKANAALAGVLMFMTYALVLISMGFVKNISYVVAFRQVSILVGTALGVLFLKEKLHRPKLIGVCIIFIGLVLVGTG